MKMARRLKERQGLSDVTSAVPQIRSETEKNRYPNSFLSLAHASSILSLATVKVIRKYPSPALPNPTPGVTTTAAWLRRSLAKADELYLFGTGIQT